MANAIRESQWAGNWYRCTRKDLKPLSWVNS
jgi:hypothetical protein